MKNLIWIYVLVFLIPAAALAQSTAFTFQGRVNDGSAAATGSVQLEIKLYDALAGGAQIGSTVNIPSVVLINGVFSTDLDFGGTAFDGSPRFLEIGLRPTGSTNPYTILGPRQHLSSVPYSIKSGTSGSADSLSPVCSGCIQDVNIGGISGSKVAGEIPPESVPTGSGNYIQNADVAGIPGKNAVQQSAGFNISGSGIIGRLGIGIAPRGAAKLDVIGTAVIQPNGVGTGNMVFGTPNSETGMTTFVGNNRADLRFDGNSIKLVAGTGSAFDPPSTNGIVINTSGNVGIGTTMPTSKFVVNSGGSGGEISIGSPNGESGISIVGTNRADVRFDGTDLKLVVGPVGGPPSSTSGISINAAGWVGIGTAAPHARLEVNGQGSTALFVNNGALAISGAIRVPGAGIGTNTAAFILVKTAANTCGGALGSQIAISNPFSDGDPNAILIITARQNFSGSIAVQYYPLALTPPGCPQLADKWSIFTPDGSSVGSQFNVLVIKP